MEQIFALSTESREKVAIDWNGTWLVNAIIMLIV